MQIKDAKGLPKHFGMGRTESGTGNSDSPHSLGLLDPLCLSTFCRNVYFFHLAKDRNRLIK